MKSSNEVVKKGEIIEYQGRKVKIVGVVDDGLTIEERFFHEWSEEKFCLEAVKKNAYALQYVKEQTEEICLEAVKNDAYALQYVKVRSVFYSLIKKKDPLVKK